MVVSSVEQETIFQHLVQPQEKPNIVPSQNGIKFRTLCENCNNKLLGKYYDPHFNKFTKDVGAFLKSTLVFPRILHFKAKPIKIIRALIGHLLAAKAQIDEVVFDDVIRDCFLNEDKPIPKDVRIYYWLYPYREIRIYRDLVYHNLRFNNKIYAYLNLVKFFPIAYLITNEPCNYWMGLNELTMFNGLSPEDDADIAIDFSSIKGSDWPEIDGIYTLLCGGASVESSIHAKPRNRIIY